MQTGQAGSPRQALGNALKGVLKNPMPWAILSGAACSVLAIQLPAPAAKTIGLLADAASPVALFTIGAVLARSRKWALLHPSTNALMQDVWPLALVKLFVHPLLVLGAGVVVQAAGLRIDAFSLAIVALVAALPSASNVTLLAERMQADVGRLAQIILVSTALAIFSFSGFVAWLGPQ
jgi:predicted permease